MSALRDLPPGQEPRRSRWSSLRLVPLGAHFALCAAALVTGVVWRAVHP